MRPIDQVLTDLDQIIAETVADNNYLGVFTYVYRRTTAQIKDAIDDGRFADGDRLERLDVIFAQRYIDAYRQWKAKEPHTQSWAEAFQARHARITILQHLFLGMNAHINLDLGIAAAEVAPGEAIHAIKGDFMIVNDILAELTEEMQDRIGRVSPLFFLADWLGGTKDETFANFSIKKARGFAWGVATKLAFLNGPLLEEAIQVVDQKIAGLARIIIRPPGRFLPWLLGFIGRWEEKELRRVIEKLQA